MLRINQGGVLAAGCLVIGVAALWLAATIDRHVKGWAFAMPGTTDATMAPSAFPAMILGLIGTLAFGTALSGLLQLWRGREISGLDLPRLLGVSGTVLLRFLMLAKLGFVLTAAAVIGGVPPALGYRNWTAITVTAVLIAVLAWPLFRYGMNVILPQFTLF